MSAASFDFTENAAVSRQIAAGGMVLLKNRNNVLPLQGKSVALFGRGQIEYYKGGLGSSDVKSAYSVSLVEGLENAEKAGSLSLDHELLEKYRADVEFIPTAKEIEAAAKRSSTAVFILSRNSREELDCYAEPGDFYLNETEEQLLEALKNSRFREIVVLVNTGRVISLSFAAKCDRIDALAILWQPGMEGGNAAADLLTGKVNFSGKLADTFAGDFSDYPCQTYDKYWADESYEEGIFVGYRYFETIPGAKEKVLYPFGFGLSYTTFAMTCSGFSAEEKTIRVTCRITNTGNVSGREVAQLYLARQGGLLEHPSKELIAFAKTRELAPGESQEVVLEAEREFALRSFDETGICGKPGSWVIDCGTAEFLLGSSVRDTVFCGKIETGEIAILSTVGNLFSVGPERQLHADGSYSDFARPVNDAPAVPKHGDDKPTWKGAPIMLSDVSEGKASMANFISQLTFEEKISLCQGQPPTFPLGTAGIGNLGKYGVPNPQTADGPAGLRKAVPTTSFPCETLLACSWDTEAALAMGKALGYEGIATGVDILLAPGLNIHRSPLSGRNFEYYSEDPLISGKMASAMVRGVQSQGMGATLKHFAVNNRERYRRESASLVTDRALREIYLKGFEIAVKEGKPWCIMSAYNNLNQRKTSCHYHLLTTVLRHEWGFDGLVMSDWSNYALFHPEIVAGNDVKMPFCDDALAWSVGNMKQEHFPIGRLNEAVKHVLELVMKTDKFRKRDFGAVWHVQKGVDFRMRAVDFSTVNTTTVGTSPTTEDETTCCLTGLAPNQPEKPCRVRYEMESDLAADFRLKLRASSRFDGVSAEVFVDGKSQGCIAIAKAPFLRFQETEALTISVPQGRFALELAFLGMENIPSWCKWNPESSTEVNRLLFRPPEEKQ